MGAYKADYVSVELTGSSLHRSFCSRPLGAGDIVGDRFGVEVFRDGAEYALTNATWVGYFMRTDGNTVAITGQIDGNAAYVDLPQACYAVEGNFSLAIKVIMDSQTSTLRIVDGTVMRTTTETQIDPGTEIPDLAELLAKIEDMEDATAAAIAAYSTYASAYDAGTAYCLGDYVSYNSKLWRCIVDIPAPGEEWTAAHWVEVTLCDEVELLNLVDSDGWAHLPLKNFSRNEWTSFTGTSSRSYRVKYDKVLAYSRDVTVQAGAGFYIMVYYADGTHTGAEKSVDIPANTVFKANVRRITEDSSETADLEVFSAAVRISTLASGMTRDQGTYSDVSMFERVGIGGDSYANGGGIISGVRSLTWGKNLERQAGITVDIYAQSGISIHASDGWNYDTDNGLPALLAGTECGLYWLAHGINDRDDVGTVADMSATTKPYTFYGQCVYAIQAIQARYPDAKIVISTVVGSSYGMGDTVYTEINTAVKNIAEYCGIPYIELTDDDFYRSAWYADGMRSNHPTAMIAAGMAAANRRLLSKCIQDNPNYFADYGST